MDGWTYSVATAQTAGHAGEVTVTVSSRSILCGLGIGLVFWPRPPRFGGRGLTCQLLLIGREGPHSATPGRPTVVLYCPGVVPALFSETGVTVYLAVHNTVYMVSFTCTDLPLADTVTATSPAHPRRPYSQMSSFHSAITSDYRHLNGKNRYQLQNVFAFHFTLYILSTAHFCSLAFDAFLAQNMIRLQKRVRTWHSYAYTSRHSVMWHKKVDYSCW